MTTREVHERRLAGLLRDVDFSRRYYEYCDAHPREASAFALSPEDQRRLIAASGLGFDYDSAHRFYGHREGEESRRMQLNVSFDDRYVEFGLSFHTSGGVIGGPFHVLARDVELLVHGPEWERDPRYPRTRFTSPEEAERAMALGLELYRDARTAILGASWE
jgi:hypothetical protein